MNSEIEIGHVETPVHGRFLLRPSESSSAPLLVAFHGYAEDASSILEAVVEIPGISRWHLASIQALNRFYRGRSGEVVASWMTKQDRELTIASNLEYVGRALAAVGKRVDVSGPRVFLGFSQGTAMTYRAAAALGCAGVVALAGDVPPELSEAKEWSSPPVLIGWGSDDAWYNESKWEQDRSLLEGLGSTVETCAFEGGHEWTGSFRRRAGKFLESLRDG